MFYISNRAGDKDTIKLTHVSIESQTKNTHTHIHAETPRNWWIYIKTRTYILNVNVELLQIITA